MKIREITVGNYKKFIEPKTISFCDEEGNVNDMNLILGENGSGKTSILQAIVASIAPLTRSGFRAYDMDWNGFEYRLIQNGGSLKVKLLVDFNEEEILYTQSYYDELKDKNDKLVTRPGNKKTVELAFDYRHGKPVADSEASLFQFFGYQYAKQLAAFVPNSSRLFDKVGSIYWYTEGRNSYSVNSPFFEKETKKLDGIRSILASAYSFHVSLENKGRKLKAGEFDYYQDLDMLYKKVFPGRSFVGTTPRFDIFEDSEAPDFFLSDGEHQYELSEMSAGERAIFPILMDFARYNINNSIIIIDEIELHLHSPLQQALVRALPLLGNNNQFILTSHSDNVVVMFNEDEIIRL